MPPAAAPKPAPGVASGAATTPANQTGPGAPHSEGGRIAIRGLHGQVLHALYRVLCADPPFTVLTLEPDEGGDKFDYTWDDTAGGRYAVQVKTSINKFGETEVQKWAKEMASQHSTRHATLCLLGDHTAALKTGMTFHNVRLEFERLDLAMNADAIAFRLTQFTASRADAASLAGMVGDALCNQLMHKAREGKSWTREELAAYLQQAIANAPLAGVRTDVQRLTAYVPTHLPGREPELARLRAAWARAGSSAGTPASTSATSPTTAPIVAIIALGGEGKTSVLAHWMAEMQANGWQGAQAVYAWSFYSQGSREQSASSADLFLHDALEFFCETDFANSNASAWDKGKKLAECCTRQRTLLLLDGAEPLQYPPTSAMRGELKDNGLLALLRGLAARQAGSLCVLTSRYELPQIKAYCDQIDLPHLPMEAAVALLRQHCTIGSEQDFQNAVQEVNGHALSLNILAHYIAEAHGGDIRQRDLLNWKQADSEERHGHAFRAMAAYQRWLEQGDLPAASATTSASPPHNQRALALLYVLCLFDRPAERTLLDALLAHPIPCPQLAPLQNLTPSEWNLCISRLQQANLLRRLPAQGAWHTLDAHPLLREYFADYWQSSDLPAFQAAHGRLFEYLQNQTKEGKTPTMQDLQPLYQAVAHGCYAGLYQQALYKVYWDRILRGEENYSIKKLGAFAADLSAVACFFSQPWQRVVPALTAPEQAFLLNEAAFHLRALGRLAEAVPAFAAGLGMQVEQQNWKRAAIAANNLAQLQLQLGQVAAACGQAEQAVAYADQSADAFQRMSKRTSLADCQHQRGQSTALALMQQAERMQQEWQPVSPLLYSLAGFQYCELLLASGYATRAQVAARARQTLAGHEAEKWLLDIALDHLSLARCGGPDALDQAHQAVAGLRQAGNSDYLPHALLTRAELLCHHAQMLAALDDLNEAFELCERSGLQLWLCDTLLTRLALFGQANPYPWQSASADLTQATALVKDCGYERRRAALSNPALVLWQADSASPD